MDKKPKNALWWILGSITLIVVAVLVVVAVVRGGSQASVSDSTSTPPEETSASSSAPRAPSETAEDSISADAFGRKVVTPANGRGNPLSPQTQRNAESCSQEEKNRAPDGLEIQRIHNVMTVWSTSDGPTDISTEVPNGYSRTPAGAALAAWNLSTLVNAGGDVSTDVLADYMGLSEQKGQEFRRVVEEDGGSQSRQQLPGSEALLVPDGHRVVSCTDDLIVVELAKPLGADASGPTEKYWQVMRIPMLWKDGHWEINGKDNNDAFRETVSELGSEWKRWDF
ncbi:hypothetical protein [Ancrocorticia populi]|uniref:hypothetical protein n=1 Tax=Ancrocorticia populi TaxID=2175228 RepID=UPI003F98F180